ncbi:MAG: class I SAM-dependent methyltransferase [Candidatus Nanopelagicales bacterium]
MTADHWDSRYADIGDTAVSWFQPIPQVSLDLIASISGPVDSVVDVGGGASRLVDHLLAKGYHDLTVVDLSQESLGASRARVGQAPVHWVQTDIRDWQPDRTFHVWHDRAAYHFLTDVQDQQRYWTLVRESLPVGGHVVVATFADDGPEMCSGLPVQRYTEQDLVAAMGESFTPVATQREEHVTPSGGTQSFVWVVARRT